VIQQPGFTSVPRSVHGSRRDTELVFFQTSGIARCLGLGVRNENGCS